MAMSRGLQLVLQAAVSDGLSFDPLSFCQDDRPAFFDRTTFGKSKFLSSACGVVSLSLHKDRSAARVGAVKTGRRPPPQAAWS